jgi:pimeloyl-ACP methyl ester carboxylesterase
VTRGTVRRFRWRDRIAFVHERGAGPTMPTLLVHGIGVARLYFTRLEAVLAASGPVLTVELPGFGRAPKRPDRANPPTIEEHSLLVAELLRQHGAPGYRIVGHSMGTQIVADLAVRDPDLVRELALLGPVTDPAARDALHQGLRLARDTLGETPPTNVAVFTDYARTGPRWYLRTLPYMLDYDLPGVLPRIAAPTLVMRGARDPIAPHGWTEQVARLLPRSRLVEVPGAHHVVQFTHADRVAAELAAGVP